MDKSLRHSQTSVLHHFSTLAQTHHFDTGHFPTLAQENAVPKFQARGIPQNKLAKKRWWCGISCICSKSLATEIICKSENLQFIFLRVPNRDCLNSLILKILCFNHFPIFSFWKKFPKVLFPQSSLVNVSRVDKSIIRILEVNAIDFSKKVQLF